MFPSKRALLTSHPFLSLFFSPSLSVPLFSLSPYFPFSWCPHLPIPFPLFITSFSNKKRKPSAWTLPHGIFLFHVAFLKLQHFLQAERLDCRRNLASEALAEPTQMRIRTAEEKQAGGNRAMFSLLQLYLHTLGSKRAENPYEALQFWLVCESVRAQSEKGVWTKASLPWIRRNALQQWESRWARCCYHQQVPERTEVQKSRALGLHVFLLTEIEEVFDTPGDPNLILKNLGIKGWVMAGFMGMQFSWSYSNCVALDFILLVSHSLDTVSHAHLSTQRSNFKRDNCSQKNPITRTHNF